MTWVARLANTAILPVAVWLAGVGLFTILGIDGLFDGANPVFVIARVTAYVTAAVVVAITMAFVVMFGLACGAMLAWLGESARAGLIVDTMSRSFWFVAGYVWFGVVLLILDPPDGLTAIELADPDALEVRIKDTSAFVWMSRLRYLGLAGFLATAVWLLARRTKPVNAALSVAFGVATLAAAVSALGLLAGSDSA